MNRLINTRVRNGALPVLAVLAASLAGCGGGPPDRSCDDVRRYQLAVEAPKVQSPDGLDPLDEFRELPLPSASPRPERPEGSPCLDLPPNILGSGG
ncbi:MAG: hypothetical protein QNJ00_09430 [Woeseiaceae bacterium]|nr:hypothetical protein [Woeseiaceae bacterium]